MILISTVVLAIAGAGDLHGPFLASAKGKPISGSIGHLGPIMYDVDADGLLDLVVGTFDPGDIRVYRNVGRPGSPKFDGFFSVQAGGKEIRVESG